MRSSEAFPYASAKRAASVCLYAILNYLSFTQRRDAPERKFPYATEAFSFDALYVGII